MIPLILLAAGASARLGEPKQLIELDGRTLLARGIDAAAESGGSPVFVVLGAFREQIAARTPELSRCKVLDNPAWHEGMSTSIRVGLQAVLRDCSDASGILLLACDQPSLSARHLQQMMARHASAPQGIIASGYASRAGIPALFPQRFFPELLTLRGDEGARQILRSGKEDLQILPLAGGEWDIDTRQDLNLASIQWALHRGDEEI